MSLQDLKINTNYETTGDRSQLLDTFYIPVLEESCKYYRIAGFFSSTALAVAAKGIEGLINNGGKMYLLISPELSDEDFKTIQEHGNLTENAEMFSAFKLEQLPNENIQALAWLLDNGNLKIKIVVGKNSKTSLFHQKIGLMFDADGNILSFSGSINETAQAWLNNIEEFKVFKSWEQGQIDYLNADLTKFLAYWKNQRQDIAIVYDLPQSIKEKIIRVRPKNVWDLNIMRRYRKDKKNEENKLSLFPHQLKAVNRWITNGYSLLMEMATGTGKTRTAIGCLVNKMKDKERLLTIVATPQNTLSRQWLEGFNNLGIVMDYSAIIDGSNSKWKKELELLLLNLSDDKFHTAIIFTTHDTASSEKFINIIHCNKYDTKILFICDEVHAIGSQKQKKALLPEYEYRIGLSATPERMFDESGTSLIRNYFGGRSFEFTIADALATKNPLTGRPFLNAFLYYPIFVNLTDLEMKRYKRISQQIAILKGQDDYDENVLQRLYDRRAEITKNANNKFDAFESILAELQQHKVEDTILFVTDKQIERCFDIMSQRKIKRAKITENESASKVVNSDGATERQQIISQFVHHQLQILVGIKCLDEGIDIPNARIAILMASSTNPREYIQRVGRVIRPAQNKSNSIIYDLIVTPDDANGPQTILQKEAKRAMQIARNAINFADVQRIFEENGVDVNAY